MLLNVFHLNFTMRLIFALLFCMILLFGCCGTLTPDDEKIEYLVYETDTYAIEYPEDWNVLIHDDGEFDENYSFVKFKSKLIVEGNMDGTEITYHVIYFQHDGKTYRIQSVSEDAKQDKYAPIFQRMKDSFELK